MIDFISEINPMIKTLDKIIYYKLNSNQVIIFNSIFTSY